MPLPGEHGSYGRELACILELARVAGAEVVKLRFGGLDVEMKAGDEPVTVADRRASELIVQGLEAAFPGDPIISEELPASPELIATMNTAPRVWLIDPIDGTKDFIRGNDGFAVMIGLLVHQRPVVGVVYQPTIDRMFFVTPDGGPHVAIGDRVEPLRVSTVATAGEARFVASASHRSPDLDQVKAELGIDNELNVGSVGVKLCLIAMGVRDLYVNPAAKTKAWDTCAPEAILAAAGGRLSDLFGGAVAYTGALDHKRGLVASNGLVHDEVTGKLGPLFSSLRR